MATHTHTYTHTLTYTHTHTDTQTYPHTHTSLTPRRVLLVMSPSKRRYSTSRSASWCPHPTLICTWATTPWLLPSVVFCCCCCVLHCTHWLCRCAGSRPCCCGAVLCVWWREGGEGTEGERGDQHNLSNNKAMQTKKSAPKRERGKKAVPKWKATRK